jgi:sugar phosphate permease
MTINKYQKQITILGLFIFFLSTLFYCYEFFIQVSPGVMTNVLMRDLSANATSIGIISGCFYYSYTAMQIPVGLLLDRYGIRIVLTTAILICAIGTLLFGLAPDIFAAAVARFLMGAGSAFAFISVLYITIRWLPACYFALFAGLTQMMSSFGALGGEAPLASMIQHTGWRYTMFIFSLIAVILAILVWLIIRDNPPGNAKQQHKKPKIIKSLKTIFSNNQTWFIGIYSFAIWAPIVAFSALWGVPFIKTSCHLSNIAAAEVVSFSWIGIAIGSPVVGWISDKIQKRCLPLTLVALLGLISILCVLFIPNMPTLVLYILLFLVGFSASGQTLIFAVVKEVNYEKITSTANGINNMAVVLGGALFQPLIGKFLDVNWSGLIENGVRTYDLHAYHVAFLILPICYLIAAIMSMFFIRETYCKSQVTNSATSDF